MSTNPRPLARTAGLLTEELDDELLVFDEQRQLACRLNRTAAVVWQSSDGRRTVAELVDLLREDFGELAEQGLIESGYARRDPDAARLSRRRFIRRVGVVGTAALALPVVQGVVAPTPAGAAPSLCAYCFACSCSDSCYCEPCSCPCGFSGRGSFDKRYLPK
jgi:hypothetical protein